MHGPWKNSLEQLPEEVTAIWSCTNEKCNGWIRANFSFEEVPVCVQCDSPMIKSEKVLPVLMSSSEEIKRYKKNRNQKPGSSS